MKQRRDYANANEAVFAFAIATGRAKHNPAVKLKGAHSVATRIISNISPFRAKAMVRYSHY